MGAIGKAPRSGNLFTSSPSNIFIMISRVATAHEFYLDRLEREKQTEERKAKPTFLKVISPPPREFNEGSVLKVKRRKNEHVYVGTGTTSVQQAQDILPSGKKRKFNEDGNYLEPLDLPVQLDLRDPKTTPPEKIESETLAEPTPIPPRRGQRIGFGSIAALPPRSLPTNPTPTPTPQLLHAAPCDSCVENETAPQEDLPQIHTKSGKSGEVDGVIITESGQYDDLSSSDGEDCLSPEELTEQSLISERERQKRIFNFIHESVAAAPPQNSIIDQSVVDIQDIEPVPIIEQIKKSPFRSAVWSQSNLRFDPTVHRKSQKFHLTQEEVEERDKNLVKRSNTGEDSREQEASGTADLGKLKDIFHRDGGLTWDSTGKGATQRDPKVNENLDNLILEAERYGFDVRGEEKGEEEKSENKTKSSMLFGFFDGDGGDDAQDSGGEDEDEDAATGDGSSSDDSNIFSEDEDANADSGDENEERKTFRRPAVDDEDHKFRYPSFEEVLTTANKFKRDLCVDHLFSLFRSSSCPPPPPPPPPVLNRNSSRVGRN
jgi:hypothetical protein